MFDQLDNQEQISYLEHCLPEKPFNEVMEHYDEPSQDAVDAVISEGKRVLISQMQQGRDQWEYLLENKGVYSEDFRQESSYRELAYYLSAMRDSGLGTYPYEFAINEESFLASFISQDSPSITDYRDYLIENGDNDIEKAFSDVGADIWYDLGSEPEPRLAHFEDEEHLYIEFWLRTDSKQQFHERRGEFVEFPVLRKIICRVHFDDEFVELRGRNERKKDKESAIIAIRKLLNNDIRFHGDSDVAADGGNDPEIQDDTIRYFYGLPEFQRLTHANKEGTATSSWTADDVRNDTRFPDDRPNNYNNLVFDIDTVGRISFQLSAEDDSFQIFKHKIMPEDQRSVSEYIMENIRNASN